MNHDDDINYTRASKGPCLFLSNGVKLHCMPPGVGTLGLDELSSLHLEASSGQRSETWPNTSQVDDHRDEVAKTGSSSPTTTRLPYLFRDYISTNGINPVLGSQFTYSKDTSPGFKIDTSCHVRSLNVSFPNLVEWACAPWKILLCV